MTNRKEGIGLAAILLAIGPSRGRGCGADRAGLDLALPALVRRSLGGLAGFNLTNGVEVDFCN